MKTNEVGHVSGIVSAVAVVGILSSVLVLAGCVEGRTPSEKFQSAMRAKPAELSDFLPNHELLEKQPDTFPFHYFYLKNNGKDYDRVYVAPVDISRLRKSNAWAELDKQIAGQLGTKMEDLTTFMKRAYEQTFRLYAPSSHLEVVDAPTKQPGTIFIETAIIAFCPTKAELNALGMASNILCPGLGLVVSAFGGGSLTVECRVRDAATGEIVSMYATTETEPRALISASQFTWSSSAQINIKRIANYTAQIYLAARDYRKVNRSFPLSWTSLVKDADLNEDGTEK